MKNYFIAPDGESMPLMGIQEHIAVIWNDPELFGFTQKELQKIYNSYGEPNRDGWKARDHILAEVYKRGWIKVSSYLEDKVSIEVWALDKMTMGKIRNFARMLMQELPRGVVDKTEVLIDALSEDTVHSAMLRDLVRGIIAKRDREFKKLSLRR